MHSDTAVSTTLVWAALPLVPATLPQDLPAWRNPRTDLVVAALLADRLAQSLARAARGLHQPGTLLAVALDWPASALLQERRDVLHISAARRLEAGVRKYDTVAARPDGGFLILLESVHNAAELQAVTARLQAILTVPFTDDDESWSPAVRIAAVPLANVARSAEEYLGAASAALDANATLDAELILIID